MKQQVTRTSVASFPVLGLLGAVLVVLKVLGKITIAWKWVLAPFWVPLAVAGGFFLAVLVFAGLVGLAALLIG